MSDFESDNVREWKLALLSQCAVVYCKFLSNLCMAAIFYRLSENVEVKPRTQEEMDQEAKDDQMVEEAMKVEEPMVNCLTSVTEQTEKGWFSTVISNANSNTNSA